MREMDWDTFRVFTPERMWSIGWALVGGPIRRFSDVRLWGRERVPLSGPVILAANHRSFYDIFVLGAALTNAFGRMVGDQRQGWAILAAMGVLPASELAGYTALGELSLDEQITAVAGVLPAAFAAARTFAPTPGATARSSARFSGVSFLESLAPESRRSQEGSP